MSAATARRAAPADGQGGADGFGPVLHAEWTKFRTVRGWVIGMLVALLITVGFGILGAGNASIACQTASGQQRSGKACVPAVPVGPGGQPVVDSYYLVHQGLGSHGSLTARVTALTGQIPSGGGPAAQSGPVMAPGLVPWAKAGIIITASTRPGAAYAAMMVTGQHGVRMQDDYTGDIAGRPGAVSPAAPRWLRLTRSGDAVTGWDSADGRHWDRVGTVTLAGLPATAQAGLFATAPNYVVINHFVGGATGHIGPSRATGSFDHVRLDGAVPSGSGPSGSGPSGSGPSGPGPSGTGPSGTGQSGTGKSGTGPGAGWAGTAVGSSNAPLAGRFSSDGSTAAGDRFTVTGSGDIAPLVPQAAQGYPSATITDHLTGAFAGLIAIAVVAAMFATAEYRRGLIRVTLAASPRRGRVLAAKALVAAAVAFAVGLVAAIASVLIGTRLSNSEGLVNISSPWLTDVRAVAGTAAILALAAVIAVAAGVLARRSVVAVTTVIVVIVVPYILGVASILPDSAADWVLRLSPAAAFAVQQAAPAYPQVTAQYSPGSGYFPLPPWAGFAVLCGYAAVAVALAVRALQRRDA